MKCPRCGSNDVRVHVKIQTVTRPRRKGFFWWLFIGWWWLPVKWIVFTLPALIFKAFGSRKLVTTTTQVTKFRCHRCGKIW